MKKIGLILMGAATLMFFVSCGSKPEPEPEVKPSAPEQVVEEPTVTEEEEETTIPETSNDEDEAAKKAAAEAADEAARNAAREAFEKALASKKKIDDNGLSTFAQKDYDEGCALLAELEDLMKDPSVSGADLEAKAKAAISKFTNVLTIAYKKLAKEKRDVAYESKKLADSVKAAVSEKETYQEGAKAFKEGDALYAMQNPEKALDKYTFADETFSNLYNKVSEKRAAAQAAIEAAKKAIADVEKLAVEADITDPVDENTKGIEAEDTVLLEETTYANPDEAVEDIPETILESVVESATEVAGELNTLVTGGDK